MVVKVSPKYQVVVPAAIREALGLRPGMEVEVIAKGKVAYLVPVRDLESIKKELKGKLGSGSVREKKDRL